MALNNTYDARLVQQETAVGAGVQVLLLALLGTAIGLGPAGWLTGLAFAIATWAVLSRALHRSRLASFGPANRVTLGRATLVGGVTALVADSFQSSPPVTLLVGLTAVALILDGVDGKVARRTGTSLAAGRPLRHGGRRVPDPGADNSNLKCNGFMDAYINSHATYIR